MSLPDHNVILNVYNGVGFSREYDGCSQSQSSLQEIKPKKDNEDSGNRDLDGLVVVEGEGWGVESLSLWAVAVVGHLLSCGEWVVSSNVGE